MNAPDPASGSNSTRPTRTTFRSGATARIARRGHRSMNTPTNGPKSVNGNAVISAALKVPTVVLCSLGLNTTDATIAAWKNPSAVCPTTRIVIRRRKSYERSAPRARSRVPGSRGAAICRRPSGLRGVEETGPVGVRRLAVAQDELLDHLAGHVVAELDRRRLHEVRRRPDQRSAEPPILRDLRAPERVDDHAGRIGRVPDLELHLDAHGRVTEVAALEAEHRPLAVLEPRHVVGRTDVDVLL